MWLRNSKMGVALLILVAVAGIIYTVSAIFPAPKNKLLLVG